jgi:hypothetical protein
MDIETQNLINAIENDDEEKVEDALLDGADLYYSNDRYGPTPLDIAIQGKYNKVIKYLITNILPYKYKDNIGNTLLKKIIASNNDDIFNYYINYLYNKFGKDYHILDNECYYWRLFKLPIADDNLKILKKLIELLQKEFHHELDKVNCIILNLFYYATIHENLFDISKYLLSIIEDSILNSDKELINILDEFSCKKYQSLNHEISNMSDDDKNDIFLYIDNNKLFLLLLEYGFNPNILIHNTDNLMDILADYENKYRNIKTAKFQLKILNTYHSLENLTKLI